MAVAVGVGDVGKDPYVTFVMGVVTGFGTAAILWGLVAWVTA